MVPMALESKDSYRNSDADPMVESIGQTTLADKVAGHLTQIDTFLQSPQRFRLSVSDSVSVLSSLPLLLRYSSDYRRRCSAVFELIAEERKERNTQSLMQMLVLGDVLSMALNASALPVYFPSVASLKVRASDCGLSAVQRRYYLDLWKSLRGRVRDSAVVADEVVESIAIALTHSSDYLAALRMAINAGATNNTSTALSTQSRVSESRVSESGVSGMPVSGMVASLVVGAVGGRTSLPVLLQMHSHNEQSYLQKSNQRSNLERNCVRRDWRLCRVINLANGLFDPWAGVAKKSRTIIAR